MADGETTTVDAALDGDISEMQQSINDYFDTVREAVTQFWQASNAIAKRRGHEASDEILGMAIEDTLDGVKAVLMDELTLIQMAIAVDRLAKENGVATPTRADIEAAQKATQFGNSTLQADIAEALGAAQQVVAE
jgi:hypothetical protein